MTKQDVRFSRADFALLLLLAGLVALFFWRVLTPNPADRAQFPPGDFTDQFYAFRLYEMRALAQGRIPLWSENFNSGHPFLADIQSAVFYPPALMNILLNSALFNSFSLFALELEALLHFYLAGAFTYLFARRVLLRSVNDSTQPVNTLSLITIVRISAFTAALVFTFGGYLTSYPSLQLAILETAAWLPLALYFLTPSPSAPSSVVRPPSLIAAGIVLGVAALAGHPQTFLFVLAVCIIYFLFIYWQAWGRRTALRVVAAITLLVLIAFGIAAVQLIPAVEYQQLSTREALSFADAAKGLPTLDVLQFILPGYASAFASPLYVGILSLWLALAALLRRGRARVFWGLVALGALLISFGFYVFAYVVLYLFVPGAALFRDQERAAFSVSFALAMLAAYGMRDVLSSFDVKRFRTFYWLLPAGAIVTFVLLIAFFIAGAQNPQGRLSFLGDRAGLMLIQFGLASLLVGLYLRNVLNARVFAVLAIVLILFDLWSVNEPANKGRVQERFPDDPLISAVKADGGLFRVAADENLLPGHFGIAYGLQDIGGISPLRLANYDEFLKLPEDIRMRLLNVKYVFTQSAPQQDEAITASDEGTNVLERQNSLPRAWLVGESMVEADDARALQRIASPQFDPLQQAVVSLPVPFTLDARAVQGNVVVTQYAAERLAMDVNAPADGLLVVSENFYPGWRATVDGEAVDILRADVTLRAIPIRAGQHHGEMWYDPLSFKVGAGISVITILACMVALGYFSINRRERRVL
ncbi:MAG TPA: YfhO family protein [Anaerolineae bacterium]|nr:YfhO family protein [Anaerolineae bacterium]